MIIHEWWAVNMLRLVERSKREGAEGLLSNPLRVVLQNPLSAFLAGVILMLALGPGIVLLFLRPYAPLGDYPVQLVESRVEGVQMPAVYRGSSVRVRAIKCSTVSVNVPVVGQTFVVRDYPRVSVLLHEGGGVREPGCKEFVYENNLPVEVITPGLWRLEGYEETVYGQDRQRKPFVSEWFMVLSRPAP